MSKALTTIDFIGRSKAVHGDVYNYTNVDYKNTGVKVSIICSEHGEFKQRPSDHLNGSGCNQCANKSRATLQRKTLSTFIDQSNTIHSNAYDYSTVDYINDSIKVNIICKIHGHFSQKPNDHLQGHGCPKCGVVLNSKNRSKTLSSFILEANIVHNDTYDYFNVNYINTHNKVEINCKLHGTFWQTPAHHLTGQGCPICNSSKGEQSIQRLLSNNNISFIRQHTFNDCRDKHVLPFDFYIPSKNILIEYDGEQHFKAKSFFGGDIGFDSICKRDLIKTKYAADKNIELIRIPYTDFNNIDEILIENFINSK